MTESTKGEVHDVEQALQKDSRTDRKAFEIWMTKVAKAEKTEKGGGYLKK